MKKAIAVCAGIFLLMFATDSFPFNAFLLQRQLVHFCGTTTPTPQPQPAYTPRKLISSMPRIYSKKKLKTYKKEKKAPGEVFSFTIPGKTSSSRVLKKRGPADIDDLLDAEEGYSENVIVKVTALGGEKFEADSMFSGIDNVLRVDTANGKVHVDIASINSLEFGEKRLNRLAVKVNLESGKTLEGYIYSRYILEFVSEDAIITTRADQLHTVSFHRD